MLIRRHPLAWGGANSHDAWPQTVWSDERLDDVRDALLDIHRIQLLIHQAQRGTAIAASSIFLVSEKARLEARYHTLVEALIFHYAHRRPPEALAAVEEALVTIRQETASFATAVERASLEVRAKQINQAWCGGRPEHEVDDPGDGGESGARDVAWADACAEVIVQACLATIRRGPASCAVRFYQALDGHWVAQRRVLIIPPQVQGKDGTISLPPVALDERLPLAEFADLLVRPTMLSFPLGILAPFPGWEATAQWRRSGGSKSITNMTTMVEESGAILPSPRLVVLHAATQPRALGQAGQPGGSLAAISAISVTISAVTHQYLYPCRSEGLGLMWPAFACELSDPDESVQRASATSRPSGVSA